MSYYDVLGVNQSATQQEIKSAYRKLAKKYHPDTGGDSNKFKQVNEAYSIIGDEQKRYAYDNETVQENFSQHNNNHQQWSFTQKDMFDQIFRGASGFHHSYDNPSKNNDIEAKVQVTLESILVDQTRTIHINQGRSKNTVNVNIPAGVNNGARIRYRGYGQNVFTQQPPGDLVVRVEIKDHPVFVRKNQHLYTKIGIDVFDALLGCEITLVNLDGGKLKVKVPSCCSHEQILRVSGKGLPDKTKNRGDLHVVVEVEMPKTLSAEQRQIIKDIKKR
jgi:curved DNA-binding protein